MISACRHKKLDDKKKCPSCLSIIPEPLTWAHCELSFKLPTCTKSITVWKNDIAMLFNIDDIDTHNSETLEDAIAAQLPPAGKVQGKLLLHNDRLLKIVPKRAADESDSDDQI